MAGGSFNQLYNKDQAGAYIDFKEVPKPFNVVGDRGIATIALPLSWGDTESLIEVVSSDLLDGASRKKIGFTAFDTEESLVLRLILQNTYKCLVYRLDSGGVKAQATTEAFNVSARYFGTAGNKITIQINNSDVITNGFTVLTFYKGLEVDRQDILTASELVNNNYVTFTPIKDGVIEEVAGVPLAGGTNGTIDTTTAYPKYLNMLKTARWQALALISDHTTLNPILKEFIEYMREETGRKVQLCTYNYADTNYEGIISSLQGYKTINETITKEMFPAWVAGATAGALLTESLTYMPINDAVQITGELAVDEIRKYLKKGQFLISTRQDGTIIVEKDINTYHIFQPTKGYVFSKNKAIRVMDEIAISVQDVWETQYIGKVPNSTTGREMFRGAIIGYIKDLQRIGAVDSNYNPEDNVTVAKGNKIDEVIADIYNLPIVDNMEILYMTVTIVA